MALPDNVTIEEFLPYLASRGLPDNDQEYALFLLEAAVNTAQKHTGRHLTPLDNGDDDIDWTVQAELGETSSWFRLPDAREITTVVRSVDDAELVNDVDYQTHVALGNTLCSISLLRPATKLVITGKFGFEEVPLDLRDAMYAHAARNYRERDAMYADQVELPEGGVVNFFRTMPPRVRLVYDEYQLRSIG